MENFDEQLLRKYLKRRIAENNRRLSGITRNFQTEARQLKKDIYREFARGDVNLYRIDKDMTYRGKKDIAVYNYFDLNTLIAYDKYLQLIIRVCEMNKRDAHRNYYTPKDLGLAIRIQVPKYCLQNSGDISTGFYNPNHPITPLFDEDNHITYERTPDKSSFEKKYSQFQLEDMLDNYLDAMLAQVQNSTPKTTTHQSTPEYKNLPQENTSSPNTSVDFSEDEDFAEPNTTTMVIRGKKYNVYTLENYFNSHFSPIKYIEGVSPNGRYRVRGFVDESGREFNGDAYDISGQVAVDSTQTGLDFIVDGKMKIKTKKEQVDSRER